MKIAALIATLLALVGGTPSAPPSDPFDLVSHLADGDLGFPVCCCAIGNPDGLRNLRGSVQKILAIDDRQRVWISINSTTQGFVPVGDLTMEDDGQITVTGTRAGATVVFDSNLEGSWTAFKDGVEVGSGSASIRPPNQEPESN